MRAGNHRRLPSASHPRAGGRSDDTVEVQVRIPPRRRDIWRDSRPNRGQCELSRHRGAIFGVIRRPQPARFTVWSPHAPWHLLWRQCRHNLRVGRAKSGWRPNVAWGPRLLIFAVAMSGGPAHQTTVCQTTVQPLYSPVLRSRQGPITSRPRARKSIRRVRGLLSVHAISSNSSRSSRVNTAT